MQNQLSVDYCWCW